jgi:hypothetical protein
MVRYVDSKSNVDLWRPVISVLRILGERIAADPWSDVERVNGKDLSDGEPDSAARYEDVPGECSRAISYRRWTSSYKQYLYRNLPLVLEFAPRLKLYSSPSERAGDFRARLNHQAREQRDLEIEKLRKKYAGKAETLQERSRRAAQRVDEERQQASSATFSAAMTFGTSLLGALFGRKKLSATNARRAATSMRSASRAADQRGDIKRAEDNVEAIADDLKQLEAELQKQVDQITADYSEPNLATEPYPIRPRKSDLSVDDVTVLWLPHQMSADGSLIPAYDDSIFLGN